MQERIELRQRQKGERQEKMKVALDRSREKREGLEKFLTEETFDTTTARTMPTFTSRPPTTITTSDVTRKLLTTPMPFNFHTDQRATRQLVGTKETVE